MEKETNDRALFTKEELAEKVKVSAVVEQDLKRIISDRLEQCGIYYRVFSRTKTARSMADKFEQKAYNEDHKLQDLIGVRINLYFDDDVDICRDIMENTFEVVEWSTSKRSEDEFKPTKLNGVFRLPEYLHSAISPATWDMCIDDTFEIQIKTMFFEGWHEIEHDMRYKGEELWKDYPQFSRFFNSILATLELCDKSMVSLFEDLGHQLYKSGNWTDMIRSHFRIKMDSAPIYPRVEQILNEDQKVTTDSIAKRIFKTSKAALVGEFLKKNRRIPINVNTIIALLNDAYFHHPELSAVFRELDVYNDGREESLAESRHYQLYPLAYHDVFRMTCVVDGSRLREEEAAPGLIFERCCTILYRWCQQRYEPIFGDMPSEVGNIRKDLPGYHAAVDMDEEKMTFRMKVRHLDMDEAGRIWYSEASLLPDADGRVVMSVRNGYAQPDRDNVIREVRPSFFSYPGYYKQVVDGVGVLSGLSCYNRRRIIREEQIGEVLHAIADPDCAFPIILIISREGEDGALDENWLGQFRVSDFTRTVWRYAHVLTCYEDVGRQILAARGLDGYDLPRMILFWPDGEVESYGPEDVQNCSFGRHLEARGDARTYDIVHGGQALYHQVVTDLREWNMISRTQISGTDRAMMFENM